jgi:hypothetical protein
MRYLNICARADIENKNFWLGFANALKVSWRAREPSCKKVLE